MAGRWDFLSLTGPPRNTGTERGTRRGTGPLASERKNVCLAYIHPGQVSAYFTESLVASLFWDSQRRRRIKNIYQDWSSANVSASRNLVTARFLDRHDADWLLWIDSDMQWDARDIDKILDSADAKERPIVGGLAFGMASDGLFPTIYQLAEINGGQTTVRVREYPKNELVRVAATGAAWLLVHRSVLEAIRDRKFNPAFPWFQETQNGDQPVGEDITFCIRAGLLGYPVFVHTGVRVGHHKSTVLTEDMFLAAQPKE